MLEIVPSNRFKRDLRLIKKRGLKIDNLRNVIDALAGERELDEKHRDHALAGDYRGFRECHVKPDLLLIYKKQNEILLLTCVEIGSHSELFQ